MEVYQVEATSADVVGGFQCNMGECRDNCCRNTTWNITVDEESYKRYEEMDNEVGRFILDCIEKSDDGIYKFKKFDHGHCPILTEEGLCRIHRDLGGEYLCRTCKTYPRMWYSLNGKFEYSLSLSCPNVVQRVLYRVPRIYYSDISANVAEPPSAGDPSEADKERVRDTLVKILHFHRFSLKEKIIYMGLFMRSLDKNPVDKAIDDYEQNMRDQNFIAELSSLANQEIDADNRTFIFSQLAWVTLISSRVPDVIPTEIKNAGYYRLMADFHTDIKENKAGEYILDAFDRLVVPYVNENKYVFENYLVYTLVPSEFLKEAEDFSGAFSYYIGVLLINLVFAAGIFHKNKEINHDEMTVAIYLLHRNVSHNTVLRKKLIELIGDKWLPLLLGALSGIY